MAFIVQIRHSVRLTGSDDDLLIYDKPPTRPLCQPGLTPPASPHTVAQTPHPQRRPAPPPAPPDHPRSAGGESPVAGYSG